MNKKRYNSRKGFTLIELMVSISIFAIVMVIVSSAMLSIVDADRRSQNLSAVVNNLDFSIENMIRDLRTGSDYTYTNCGTYGTSCISFTDKNGNQIQYYRDPTSKYIFKLVNGGGNTPSGQLTSSNIIIDSLVFTIKGNNSNDGQPIVLMQLQGHTNTSQNAASFQIETMITQRNLDITG